MATESQKRLMRADMAHFNFTPEEQEKVIAEVFNMRHDRAIINAATKNYRVETSWSRTPTGEFSGTMAGWYETLVKLTSHVIDLHFKDESEKHHAFILVSPDVKMILWGSGKLRASDVENPEVSALCHEGYLGDLPVYVDCYLRPDVLYIGSGHIATPGAVAIDSLSLIKVENMFDLEKLK